MADDDPRSVLADLRSDATRGAAEIAAEARAGLARLATLDEDPATLAADARQAVLRLVEAHPAMAPLIHLADATLTGVDEEGLAALATLVREPRLTARVAAHAREAIAEADQVATYSRSGTVLAALEAALDTGELHVMLSEARPGDEGLTVARSLADAGAHVQLTTDADLFSRVDEADVVLVGADAITAEAFVNKTGTRVLLDQARSAGVETRVLASSDKLWPAALPAPRTGEGAHWRPEVPDDVRVEAPLFERVPLRLADRLVTEEGPAEPDALAARVEKLAIHPDLVDAVDG